ncbi:MULTISPECIES: LacI family DNA-binding transcriptional regulator [Actinopolyspora]|uniref:Transcriptional regulator, LacI family n=1 Tax=Actinopolyspora saharensis TaxID=995062 RepID=A0A1H0ZD84_9ACTN|nr:MULTISPECIES: LacI family DNA-binding transcriptional regulator [Actinopolyspora]NHD15857.1 LacI family transcriptional regulator [Actinopolyspora sp. BKK2]NHE74929.1 LacI family transcriptional regulator [Actinopolyspora sp. BKK1]SDQ25363.1 transcriptional regulator, LacI family [Actinopolyspora saharensis]
MPRGSGKVNLVDVARQAGVSLATASRVLNGSTRSVGTDLRERVRQAAARLDYSPSAPAQAMARGGTDVVGLVVPDIADPYFSTIAASIVRTAEPHGLIINLSTTERRFEREAEYVASLRRQQARGIVLVGSRTTNHEDLESLRAEVEAYTAAGGRAAAIGQHKLPADTVVVENRAGASALAEKLVELGYREFAVLAGPTDLITARDRLAGFRQGLRDRGIELPRRNVLNGAFTRDGGHAAAQELLDRGGGVECVFAVNDVMAVGALSAFRERGVRLPEELAVAGFDDIASLRDVWPSLTTVRIPLERLGEEALGFLLDEPADRARVRRFRGEVVVRASTPGIG